MGHSAYDPATEDRRPWNAGRKIGAKRALKPQQVWAIRFWLDRERRLRDRALFDLAIDSKLRGCDVVKIKISELVSGGHVRSRAIVIQQKTGRPLRRPPPHAAKSAPPTSRKQLYQDRAARLLWVECRHLASRVPRLISSTSL
jgi:hypothetical protein